MHFSFAALTTLALITASVGQAGHILLNGARMDGDTKRKLLKLVLVCLLCLGLVTGLVLLIQSFTP